MIYLMRHGRDDEEFLGGWSDNELTEDGVFQVKNAALYMLKSNIKINKIVCSPIKRAYDSAVIVGDLLGVKDIIVDERLKEQNKGKLNGMNKKEANIKYPEYLIDSVETIYPEGESLKMLNDRIVDNIELFSEAEDGTLFITHRGVINSIYYYLNKIELDMNKTQFGVGFASIHEVDFRTDKIFKIY